MKKKQVLQDAFLALPMSMPCFKVPWVSQELQVVSGFPHWKFSPEGPHVQGNVVKVQSQMGVGDDAQT